MDSMKVERLDHHGIVAGIIDELKIVEIIDGLNPTKVPDVPRKLLIISPQRESPLKGMTLHLLTKSLFQPTCSNT